MYQTAAEILIRAGVIKGGTEAWDSVSKVKYEHGAPQFCNFGLFKTTLLRESNR